MNKPLVGVTVIFLGLPCLLAQSNSLDETCTVSVLNRTVQVKANGTWVLPNIPANFGPVRARATCTANGVTRSGQSALFTIPAAGSVDVPQIILGPVTPIPTQLTLAAIPTVLTQAGQMSQVTVTGAYTSGGTANLTSSSTGTQYRSSNPALATVSANGLVTALQSGTVIIQATNEGTQGLLSFSIQLSRDSDGDGILDDIEIREGLNPNNPADGLDDLDRDGLNNRDELTRGTNIRNPDTDGDGIMDGEEVIPGVDGFITNPLLADTDGDGVPDKVEVASGSNPTNASSVNLAVALNRIIVAPANFLINVNSIEGQGFQQLTVTGEFKLGGTINLTSRARGTNYQSTSLQVCNFGAEDGRVFGGNDGSCTITVSNSGFSAIATGVVRNTSPNALSFVSIPGYANNVDISGNFAYVAAGSTGLQVVNVTNRSNPQVVASRETPGNANDVVVVGNYAYIADGSFGLQIVNISNPLAPVIAGALDTPGTAWDVVVRGNHAFVADGEGGLRIINVTNPASPSLVGSLPLPGTAKGVDVDLARNLAVVAAGTNGLQVVNITNLASPSLITTLPGGDVRDLALKGNFAILADMSRSMTTVDLTNPAQPFVRASTPSSTGGLLMDVAVSGNFALGADVFFVNGVPIVDVSDPASPQPRAILNFGNFRDDNGTGIAADATYVYMTADLGFAENGVIGDTRLYIGQFLTIEDKLGIPPAITLTSPPVGSSVIRGSNLTIRANAQDDIAVASVIFNVNGVDVSTDTSSPFETTYAVPENATSLTIIAKALDLGGNLGVSSSINVTAIPDPLTTVTGRIIRQTTLTAVVGATVVCLDRTVVSGANGAFLIPGVPTIRGDITCNATFVDGAQTLRGSSPALSPVPAGITLVGDIALRTGSQVLLLSDATSSGLDSLVQALNAAGNQVTVRPPPEYTWDNTNPSLSGFGCVIHLDGATPANNFSVASQQALIDFVRAGGGYIASGWTALEFSGASILNDLAFFNYDGGIGTGNATYTKLVDHPVLAGVPNQFTLATQGDDAGTIINYSTNPVQKLMVSSTCGSFSGTGCQNGANTAGVFVRQVGTGRAVKFSFMAHWVGQAGGVLADSNAQKLFINAVQWSCK